MKIKTRELTGAALDWAVANALGHDPQYDRASHGGVWYGWTVSERDRYRHLPRYSSEWSEGGPIIERERIATEWSPLWDCWAAPNLRNAAFAFMGPTPLIAALRCYVASKLGDEVEIQKELL